MSKVHSLLHFVTTEPLHEFTKRMELVGTLDPGFSTRWVGPLQAGYALLYRGIAYLLLLLSFRLGVHYALFLGESSTLFFNIDCPAYV